jgi:hypothetical protein
MKFYVKRITDTYGNFQLQSLTGSAYEIGILICADASIVSQVTTST